MRVDQFIRKNNWVDAAIPIVFILAFGVAAGNHAMDMVRGGLFPYTRMYGAPEILNYYWTSLTLLDPLAIAALTYNVRAGYILALGIMLTDVPINLYAHFNYWQLPLYKNPSLLMQAAFLIFLLATIHRVWRLSGRNRTVPY